MIYLEKKINRRKFLGTSAVLACSAMLPSVVTAGEEQRSPSKDLRVLKEYHPVVNSAWIRKGQQIKSFGLVNDILESTVKIMYCIPCLPCVTGILSRLSAWAQVGS